MYEGMGFFLEGIKSNKSPIELMEDEAFLR